MSNSIAIEFSMSLLSNKDRSNCIEKIRDPSEKTDFELAKLTGKGDMLAFEVLYLRHHGRVYSICLKMLHNVHEAEDLTQEVFIQVKRKASTFRGDAQFTTWLHRLTVNQVLMYFRKSQVKFEKLTSQGQLPVDDSPEAIHARKNFIDERMALVAAVGKLPDGYRNVFILHDIEGFEHNEVARILGCSEGTSKSQLFKARLSLRKLLRRKANPRVYKICHSAP